MSFFCELKRPVAFLLLVVTVTLNLTILEYVSWPTVAEAAVVTVDASVSTDANSFFFGGSQTVFISDQVGYKFYRDSTGQCVYSKTTNGAVSWNTPVIVDAQTDCASISVWYDQWTPNDFGTLIHIATMDTAAATDRLYYNRLDTNSDTLLLGTAPVVTSSNSGQGGTFTSGTNNVTITKSTSNEVFMAISDASDSFVVRCSTNCNLTTGWTEAGPAFMDLDNDWNILMPLTTGGVILINRDISLDDIRSRVWNGSSWSVSWNNIDTNAIENATYDVSMAAVIDHASGDIYLAYGADHDNFTTLDHDIRTAKFSSGSWTSTAAIFTNRAARGLHTVAIALDTNTSTVYVAYIMRTTPGTATTGNVYWATSTAAMSTWSAERGPVNITAGDLRGLDLNLMSDERIYVTWQDPAPDDIFGETLADIAPVTKLTASGTPVASITGSTSSVYVGGKFVIRESVTSRNITDIVLTERGTIAADTALANIRLQYDLDTTAPHDCSSESYAGTESQYGLTDTDGFSSADGTVSFSGLLNISPTQTFCGYVVLDVLDSALDGDTLAISVEAPNDQVLVTGGGIVSPTGPVRFATSTLIQNDELTQTSYHWRNDNGTEAAATSATGGIANTPLAAILPNTPRRIRLQVSNEGSLTSASTAFRLEYAEASPTCDVATGWTDVGASNDAWNMSLSANLTEGANTTNIAIATGGVADENTTFLTPNGGVRESSSQTGNLTLLNTNFVELEYSIVASTSASEGTTYCFRVTNAGSPLPVYTQYPSATIAADLSVSASGTQVASLIIPSTNQYVGGQFVLRENTSNRNITSIMIAETGSIDATNLTNVRLRYDIDTTAPQNCASESYAGTEPQFGATDTDGFNGENGTSTFSGTLNVTTTATICLYVVFDVGPGATNGETIQIEIISPANDISVSAGSVSPSTPVAIVGTTTLAGAVMTQSGYHWRNNNGGEATSTSATAGVENTVLSEHLANTPIRLRLALSNEGAATSVASTYRLEFGPRVTTCEAVSVWTPVGDAADDWDMFDSSNLVHGANTTNIAVVTGGVTDPNPTFLATNAGVRDTTSTSSSLVLSNTQFTELEFSITSTNITAFNTTYCFRLTSEGRSLPSYIQFAQITTAPKRDYKVQRGTAVVAGLTQTLVAGVDYAAPTASTTAFVRITDAHHTPAGRTTAGGGAQNADDYTAFISNPTNITTSFTISRPPAATGNTRVNWEIVEFIGDSGTDNEMIVRGGGTVNLASAALVATGTVVTGVAEDSDIVVYVTGIENRDTARNVFYAQQVTAEWDAATNQPVFRRGAGGAIVNVSYAVVEYTGINWRVQRVEHTYASTTVVETQNIEPVNSLARTFVHTQKRMGALGNVNNFGHEVWLSSIGQVSFRLEPAATTPTGHVSVAWIVENQQTSAGAMKVQRTNGTTNAGTEPVTVNISIFTPIESTNNASIFGMTRVVGANTNFPLVNAGLRITGTTTYELWRSEASAELTYRTEIVEWPVSGLAVRQNYYRFYVNNNALTPTDPWPPGPADVGENSPVTALDEPLGETEVIRLRMTLRVANAILPAGLYDFKLQYGLRVTSCSSVGTWSDLGSAGGSGAWRGVAATGTTNGDSLSINPPNSGDLVISLADRAGSLTEENPSVANPYLVNPGEDVEYDWYIQHNGAISRNTYCFRMVRSDGTPLDGYLNYPQLRTAGYSPQTKNWRFYDDAELETQSLAFAAENISPIEIQNQNVIALRVTVGERKNVTGQNVKFKLQFDEDPNFTAPKDVVATSTCTATSTWCYAVGGGVDNATITTKLLSDADTCVASVGNGCGTHNSSATFVPGFTHQPSANKEFVFYLRHAAARAGAVYYFRLYEVFDDVPVPVANGEVTPSLVAETAKLTLNISGLPAGTTTAGITTTVSSTPLTVAFGSLPLNTDVFAAHRIGVTTNATEGYRVLAFARQQLLNVYGTAIPSITGTNAAPVAWSIGCLVSATGCVGYHTTDAVLSGGSTRFAALDTYAGLSQTPAEVMYNPIPANDIHDIVYRVRVGATQPAGNYQTEIVYIAIPTY